MMKRTIVVAQLVMLAGAVVSVEAAEGGEALFASECAACHGAKGEGNEALKGPSIAGLPEWYVVHELGRFKKRLRGADGKDEEGVKMHAVSVGLDEEEVASLSAYVSSLKRAVPSTVPTVIGNAQRGGILYAEHCAGCHQADGTGSEAEKAPPLIGYQDWYLAAQLEKFKAGLRTLHPQDVESTKMHAMVKKIDLDGDMRDLISYIRELAIGKEDE
jgi:cytochrome c oxidase subunit 2